MHPLNGFVNPMLTDLYQLTMAYAYWKAGRHEDDAVFDLFFRTNPFGGEFTIFAGLEEVLKFVGTYRFTDRDISFLKDGIRISKDELQQMFEEGVRQGFIRKTPEGYQQFTCRREDMGSWKPIEYPDRDMVSEPLLQNCENGFFEWLNTVDCSRIRVYAPREGSVVFPRMPLIRVEGPLAIAQLLETTLLNLVNYPSLVATKAARLRLAAGKEKLLLEFGLRRAQGPDGAFSASRYTYIGGFDGTSNVMAGKLLGIPTKGTHAHSFVSSFSGFEELKNRSIVDSRGVTQDFVAHALKYRQDLGFTHTNDGELAAFVAYAQAFPAGFLALVDTYDTIGSGIPNFLCVALALNDLGYKPIGIRLDSGDLSYFSREARRMFNATGMRYSVDFSKLTIVASNDINEEVLTSLNHQGHEIDCFGIGTHLVTCYEQPALGGIYKLVMIKGKPRIKLSQDIIKVTIPGKKSAYRLIGREGYPVLDLMIQEEEEPPKAGDRILCRHPFHETKRVFVTPATVIPLHRCVWDGRMIFPIDPIDQVRSYALEQIHSMRQDHLRIKNPTPYKVSVSDRLYHFIHELWLQEAPIAEIG